MKILSAAHQRQVHWFRFTHKLIWSAKSPLHELKRSFWVFHFVQMHRDISPKKPLTSFHEREILGEFGITTQCCFRLYLSLQFLFAASQRWWYNRGRDLRCLLFSGAFNLSSAIVRRRLWSTMCLITFSHAFVPALLLPFINTGWPFDLSLFTVGFSWLRNVERCPRSLRPRCSLISSHFWPPNAVNMQIKS